MGNDIVFRGLRRDYPFADSLKEGVLSSLLFRITSAGDFPDIRLQDRVPRVLYSARLRLGADDSSTAQARSRGSSPSFLESKRHIGVFLEVPVLVVVSFSTSVTRRVVWC